MKNQTCADVEERERESRSCRVASRRVASRRVASFTRLSLAQLQHLGESLSLRWRQILLRLELLLQLDGLVVGEANLSAFPLVHRPLDERRPQQRFTCRTDEYMCVKCAHFYQLWNTNYVWFGLLFMQKLTLACIWHVMGRIRVVG